MKILFIFIAILLFVIYILSSREEKRMKKKYEPKGKLEEYWSGKERRRVERFEAMLDVEYRYLKSPKLKTSTRSKDISEDGICILAYEILPKDSTIELEIAIPNIREAIYTQGKVVWCEDIGKADQAGRRSFLTGIRFVKIDDNDKTNLVNYITSHLTSKEGR